MKVCSPNTMTNNLLLLLIFHLFAAFSISSEGRCLENHRRALLQLKGGLRNSTYLPSWTNATDSDCCVGWQGVTCDPVSMGEVTSLDLNGLNLEGRVDPDALFSLTKLTTLNLAFNYLDFSKVVLSPRAFEKLDRLTVLNLSNSGFEGEIPMGISTLTNLVSLDLSFDRDHYFEGEIPVALPQQHSLTRLTRDMKNLEKLHLDGVDLSGIDWSSVLSESHPRLAELSLRRCNISGPVDASVAKLDSLTELHLDENKLTSMDFGFLRNLPSLEVLELWSCELTGSIPEEVFLLSNLRILDMSTNPSLGGSLSEMFQGLVSLEYLGLTNCNLSGSIPLAIWKLPRLKKLYLSYNNLSGGLPPELESRSISRIYLGKNSLTGSIPSKLLELPSLTHLHIDSNYLTGRIPSSLFSLPSLKVLNLKQNKLSGNLGKLPNAAASLISVDLSSNNLQGSIPSALFNLSRLGILLLAHNNFSGEVQLHRLAGLPYLDTLDLSYNRLTVMESDSSDAGWKNSSLASISILNLASCNLTRFPLFLKYRGKLDYLDLSVNRIAGNIPSWLWMTGAIDPLPGYLNLSHNKLSGFEEPLLDPLKSTFIIIDLHNNKLKGSLLLPPPFNTFVDYSNNHLSSEIPENISRYLTKTEFFSISNNSFSGKIPPKICESSYYLRVLDVSLNNLSGPVLPCLSQLPFLSVLNLGGNKFGGKIPSNFNTNCTLRTLDLNSNQLYGNVPGSLKNCQNLVFLDLGKNKLDGVFPGWLGNLSYLRILVLRYNRFVGPVAMDTRNGSFERLHIFDLSSNNFSGHLARKQFLNMKAMITVGDSSSESSSLRGPQMVEISGTTVVTGPMSNPTQHYQETVTITIKRLELKYKKNGQLMKLIDVSNNGFVGSIPDEIGQLNALVSLNASHNHFSGVIPRSIGNLKRLESLDMSKNQLSGQIPREVVGLNFLSSLNLSYNNLSGVIPQGGQFNTFEKNSFLGNPGLCGSPLQNSCSNSTASNRAHHENKLNWEFFSFGGLGFGCGLGLIVASLLLCQRWRKLFYGWVDYTLLPLFISLRRN